MASGYTVRDLLLLSVITVREERLSAETACVIVLPAKSRGMGGGCNHGAG